MPTLKDLRERKEGCDPAKLFDLQALYEGGDSFDARLTTFLPKRDKEPAVRYDLRKAEANYRNYIGPIIDYFAALLFTSRPVATAKAKGDDKPLTDPGEFYGRFRDDCTGQGADVDAVMKDRLTDAMVNRVSWVVVEQRDDGKPPAESMAEFEERKLGDCWLRPVDATEVYDWDTDDRGLEWVLIHSAEAKRKTLTSGRGWITEKWEHFTRDRIVTYAITYDRKKPPNPETTDVPQVSDRPHRFGRVPVVPLELPVGLWVANRLKKPQLSHFRLSAAQNWGLVQTCYAMPVFTLAADEKGNYRPPTMGAGYGIYIANGGKVDWLAPPTGHFSALAAEILSQKDEIYRIVHQMAQGVENNAAAVGRSGDSKKEDAAATRVIMLACSRVVKECIELIYDLVSTARGEKHVWSVAGLDDFAAADISALVDILERVEDPATIGGIPSKTFNVAMKTRLADALLPDMDQETKQKIHTEIEQGVAEQEKQDKEMLALGKLHMKAAGGMDPNEDTIPPGNRGTGGAQPKKPASSRSGRAPASPPAP